MLLVGLSFEASMTMSEFLSEKASERDRFEPDLSDTFEVKASIVLLILTFLEDYLGHTIDG
jgi:hypothetical protein